MLQFKSYFEIINSPTSRYFFFCSLNASLDSKIVSNYSHHNLKDADVSPAGTSLEKIFQHFFLKIIKLTINVDTLIF